MASQMAQLIIFPESIECAAAQPSDEPKRAIDDGAAGVRQGGDGRAETPNRLPLQAMRGRRASTCFKGASCMRLRAHVEHFWQVLLCCVWTVHP